LAECSRCADEGGYRHCEGISGERTLGTNPLWEVTVQFKYRSIFLDISEMIG